MLESRKHLNRRYDFAPGDLLKLSATTGMHPRRGTAPAGKTFCGTLCRSWHGVLTAPSVTGLKRLLAITNDPSTKSILLWADKRGNSGSTSGNMEENRATSQPMELVVTKVGPV
jgi:hypothetical protein